MYLLFCLHVGLGLALAFWEFNWKEPHKFIAVIFLGGFVIYSMVLIELIIYGYLTMKDKLK